MDDSIDIVLTRVRGLADKAIRTNVRIQQLTDCAVVTTLIRDYFRSSRESRRTRHMVDVGAARGSMATVFLRDGWTADLFEPDPACHPALEQLVALYSRRCRLFRFAVGNENRETVQYQLNTVAGLSGLATSPFGTSKGSIPVRCVRLSDFLTTQNVVQLDFLKIDTEGTDFDVLTAHNFDQLPPTLIFAEYSFYFPGQSPEWLRAKLEWMAGRGYHPVIFDYDDDGNFRRGDWDYRLVGIHLGVDRVPARTNSFGNILFYRQGDAHLLRTLIGLIEAL